MKRLLLLAFWLPLALLISACQASLPSEVQAIGAEQTAAYLAQVSPGASIASQRWAEPTDITVVNDGRADLSLLDARLPAGATALCYSVIVDATDLAGESLSFTLYGLAGQAEPDQWQALGRLGQRRPEACQRRAGSLK